ncbi:hypothetical protein [Leucobacter triazinivorans]|uniref:TOMM leader peptide-binding protein n=1 Tax=Leucobacter triazinivorans TaxID=1784719 RepID=A0A4P6KCY3_9MICO|nr:hypothetical protein [Leucobacter triazinivorans]QBE47761.1 hypothetical protein EVS81_02045 [Leucobacter triazinivorans]
MNEARTRIHPDLSLCWEDPETLRIGFERARARVHSPSPGAQRFIGRLLTGVPSARLIEEAQRAGVAPRDARRLLERLAPALDAAAPEPAARARGLRAVLDDAGREAPGLRDALIATGLCMFDAAIGDAHRPSPRYDLAIHVERYLEPLERAQRWLIEEVPQLLIRFTDGAVEVGPLVGPGGRPCHTCISLAFVRRDPAYPVLAAQLWGKIPASESGASVHMATAYAAVLIRGWLDGDPAVHTRRFRIPVRTGTVHGLPSMVTVAPHDECACTLTRAARPPPRSETARGPNALLPRPRRAAARPGRG